MISSDVEGLEEVEESNDSALAELDALLDNNICKEIFVW